MNTTDFVPIRVSTLRGEVKIGFNAYIRVNDMYVLYCRKGDNFLGEQLVRIKKKNLRKLYIKAFDEPKYRAYMLQSIEAAYDKNSSVPIEDRAEVVHGAQQAISEDVIENVHDPKVYDEAKSSAEKYIQFLLDEDKALKSVLSIENLDKNIAHHGVNVASIAVAIAEELGMSKTHSMKLLAVGCYLHDYNHSHTNFDPFRDINTFTNEEMKAYKLHPKLGAIELVRHKHFDQEVIDIVLQHEEHIDGTGFPKGLKENNISPLAKIAAVANIYDRFVTVEKLTPKEALKKLIWDHVGLYPLSHLEALKSVFSKRGVDV